MKQIKFIVLMFVLAVASSTVFASGAGASFDSASSDCTSLNLTYSILYNFPTVDYEISGTGISQIGLIPSTLSQHTVTIAFATPVLDGTTLTITIGLGYVEDTIVINCIVSQVAEVPGNHYFNDGRVEPYAADHVIYPSADGIKVYTDEGELVLFIPAEIIEAIGIPEGQEAASLLGELSGSYVQIYRLSDGRFQVLVGPDFEGKVHVAYWEGLASYSHGSVETSNFMAR